ncbi:hypothetical protein DFH94DRAFT_749297 [Russula ochroleuca]|uniref:Uncharacterized protein n=1 Tax=Russula ochroleuca TaxID=152965 RepID=A0A9P5MTC8_9AGAM|nr:hypothetical protein DFH94DRAFT_749297 [Russula ochroleuca]
MSFPISDSTLFAYSFPSLLMLSTIASTVSKGATLAQVCNTYSTLQGTLGPSTHNCPSQSVTYKSLFCDIFSYIVAFGCPLPSTRRHRG